MIPRKKISEKLEIAINTFVSIIKQHWKKIAEIPQEPDFIILNIQNFVHKVKQFVKYYITWLVTQLVVIDMVVLRCYFAIAGSLICSSLMVDL